MSYSTFSYSDLVIGNALTHDESITLEITVTVRNDGAVVGSEVVQVYITYPNIGLTTPKHQLKGFAKAHSVAPGASKNVFIKLDKYALSFWDIERSVWHAAAGQYVISVGANSEDFRLWQTFSLNNRFFWSGL